jgi:hypothetical protein
MGREEGDFVREALLLALHLHPQLGCCLKLKGMSSQDAEVELKWQGPVDLELVSNVEKEGAYIS